MILGIILIIIINIVIQINILLNQNQLTSIISTFGD